MIREPTPVPCGRGLFFPDFELRPALAPRVGSASARGSWLLEIVGFWTGDYLRKKLAQIRAAKIDRLILCVDAQRCADHLNWPGHARVIPYRRRVPVDQVIRVIEQE